MIDESLILFSTQAEVIRYRKRAAAASPGASLGMDVTTPEALVEELWDVWGSGERLVSASQRKMLIKMLLSEQDSWVASAGTVDLLAPFVSDFITYLDDDFCAEHQHEFSPTDEEIIRFVRRYEDALSQAGLIETAQALEQIAFQVTLANVTVRTQQALPVFFRSFLEQVAESVQDASPQLGSELGQGCKTKLSIDHDKRFFFLEPAGKTVSASVIFDELLKQPKGTKSIITSPDPLMLFDLMKHALLERDIMVSLEASISFGDTYFGRIYHAINVLYDPHEQLSRESILEAATLYLESPYAGISSVKAQMLFQEFKADRTLTCVEICAKLKEASRNFEYLEELLMESDAEILFGYFESQVQRMRLSDSEKECELAAIRHVQNIYREGCLFGMAPSDYIDLIEQLVIPYESSFAPCRMQADGCDSAVEQACEIDPFSESNQFDESLVLLTSLDRAARYPAGCCDVTIMTSLDSDHYSGAQHHSTVTEFLERFGLPFEDETFALTEAHFIQGCNLARSQVFFEYPRHTANGDELYPAFFLESFLTSCEEQNIPIERENERGEDDFARSSRLLPLAESDICVEPLVVRGSLHDSTIDLLIPFENDSEGISRPVLSPSAIESYLKCPYCWFAERKLHLSEDEEAFGPREIGSFVHEVFQAFYHEWVQHGKVRVSGEDLEEASILLGEIFDRAYAEQLEKEPGKRLVAQNELEQMRIVELKGQMLQSLRFQHELFIPYQVFSHEIPIDRADHIVYAGAIIQGRIDRIDKDDKNNFIVIDYKGSLKDHEAGFDLEKNDDLFELPEKVQALIYAQAWKRKVPGMHPRGAVYLSYKAKKRKDLLSGSLAEIFSESSTHMTKKSVVKGDFERYLDLVEDRLSETVTRMVSGDISPNPCSAAACRFCPVLYCEKRVNGS